MSIDLNEAATIQKGLKERLVELINDENTIIASVTYSCIDDSGIETVKIEYIVGDSVQT